MPLLRKRRTSQVAPLIESRFISAEISPETLSFTDSNRLFVSSSLLSREALIIEALNASREIVAITSRTVK